MMNKLTLTGESGGAWDEETHQLLHPKNFNHGMAKYIVNNIKPTSMLEFGSGLGFLSKYIIDNSKTDDVVCIEPNNIKGVYDAMLGPKLVQVDIFNDNLPAILNRQFDLVISIEVAEHIDRSYHNTLFDFLVGHTNNWLIFSGARIGQGGHGHIAERDEEDWKSELLSRDMIFENDLTKAIREACDKKNINHRKNLMIFRKK